MRLPYRMWRAPALDFVVSAGVTYRASDGVRVDRQSSVYAAGEIARLSYDAQMTTTRRACRAFAAARLPFGSRRRAARPAQGDAFRLRRRRGLRQQAYRLGRASGRGAVITNRPLTAQAAFDRTRFEGDLPSGWEAEIYRNGELLGFAKRIASQRYVFDDVQLLYGENRIAIVALRPPGADQDARGD